MEAFSLKFTNTLARGLALGGSNSELYGPENGNGGQPDLTWFGNWIKEMACIHRLIRP
jgi:hypothetical protein